MKKAPDKVLAALEELINYNWDAEIKDYAAMHEELGGPDDHIFACLVTINNWLHDYDLTPEQYLEGYSP